jgi:hypothetical protein
MKRSRTIALTLAGISLGLTGCRRGEGPGGGTGVLPLSALPAEMRAKIPSFTPGQNVTAENPPLNAYDPYLGYYHQPCSAWFPYPYDHYDSRWGYYRCGKWSRHASTHRHGTGYRSGGAGLIRPMAAGSSDGGGPVSTGDGDYTTQPAGAPVHAGVPQGQATAARAGLVSRGGFGSTGKSSGSFFSSGS